VFVTVHSSQAKALVIVLSMRSGAMLFPMLSAFTAGAGCLTASHPNYRLPIYSRLIFSVSNVSYNLL